MAEKKQVRVVMPEPLYRELKRYSGGNQTRFILDAVRERLRRIQQQQLEKELAEGYRLRAEEHRKWAGEASALYDEVLGAEPEGGG